ncbi:hypothetical protein MKX01_006719, partial [Papaver californicum]
GLCFANVLGTSLPTFNSLTSLGTVNALVLQKMTIGLCKSHLPVDSENKAMENLLLFPRVSTRCIVELL